MPAFDPYLYEPFQSMYMSKCNLNVVIVPASIISSGSSFHTPTTQVRSEGGGVDWMVGECMNAPGKERERQGLVTGLGGEWGKYSRVGCVH